MDLDLRIHQIRLDSNRGLQETTIHKAAALTQGGPTLTFLVNLFSSMQAKTREQ